MDYSIIIVAIISACASFAGSMISNRSGFIKLQTEFSIKQSETERRLSKVEDKLDQLMKNGGAQ